MQPADPLDVPGLESDKKPAEPAPRSRELTKREWAKHAERLRRWRRWGVRSLLAASPRPIRREPSSRLGTAASVISAR